MFGPMLQARLSQLKISFRSTLSVPARARQLNGGKESRLGDADALAGGRHGTFRLRHVRPPFQQVGGQTDGNVRRPVEAGGFRQRKTGRQFGRKARPGRFPIGRAAVPVPPGLPAAEASSVWACATSTALSAPPWWRDSTSARFFLRNSMVSATTCRSRSTDRIIKYVWATSA